MIKKVRTQIKNSSEIKEYNSNLIINKNVFMYKEDKNVVLKIFDESVELKRYDDEVEMFFTFNKNTKSTLKCFLKKQNLNFFTEIKTLKLLIKPNKILINYSLDEELFEYILEVKEDL